MAAVLAAWPAVWLVAATCRAVRARVRQAHGWCHACGYDLLIGDTPADRLHRCPECGPRGLAPVVPRAAAELQATPKIPAAR